MRLEIRHVTTYAYEPAARKLALRLKLWPASFDAQRVERWSVTVNGEEVPPLLEDDFGTVTGLWHAHQPEERAEVVAAGVVETGDAAGVVRGLGRARAAGAFLRETPLTEPDEALAALARDAQAAAEGEGPLPALHALMSRVNAAVDYRPGATDARTPAARALALGAGVCQDHSHVFIAASRCLGLPARYVSGYLLSGTGGDALHETHGWAESWVEGLGWVGFDAANDVCPTDRYVRLASGLDARDAAPIRGSVTGGGDETMSAEVEIGPAAEAQAQQ